MVDIQDFLHKYLPMYDVIGSPEQLSGGLINFVWRVPATPTSLIVKVAPPYIATAPDIPFDPTRIHFEADAMRYLDDGSESIRLPKLLHFDAHKNIIVMEDVGQHPHLGEWVSSAENWTEQAETIGRYIAHLHKSSWGDEQLAERFNNSTVQAVRYGVLYEPIGEMLHSIQHPHADTFGEIAKRLGRTYQTKGQCLTMGDLWLSAFLMTPNGIRIIDWELCHFGRPSQDIGHLFAHLWMLNHTGSADIAPFITHLFSTYLQQMTSRLSPAFFEECAIHAGCELLMRSIGGFRSSSAYSEWELGDKIITEVVETAVSWINCCVTGIDPLSFRSIGKI